MPLSFFTYFCYVGELDIVHTSKDVKPKQNKMKRIAMRKTLDLSGIFTENRCNSYCTMNLVRKDQEKWFDLHSVSLNASVLLFTQNLSRSPLGFNTSLLVI